MFFGREVKVNQKKAAPMTMETDIKLSQAVLDPSTKGLKKEPVCLMAEIQGKSFILAVLDPSQSWQCPLDLMLGAGTEVKFYLKGQGTVHLTGYEFQDDDNFDMSMSSDDDDLEQSSDEVDTKHAAKKIKVKSSPQTNGTKNHSSKAVAVGGDDVDMDDSDDSDDDTFNSNDADEEDDEDEEESESDEDDVACLAELSGSGLDEEDDDDSD